ncbi:hypothetical protein ACIO02_34020 [Streptomyces sp. NPDC087568]|uniref:hypothetical protein n=1 Tax=unclassified Streptomyces TaxID=2593676 RepID=UPI0036EE0DAF
MARKRLEHAAPRREFITLDELAAFVQDALRSGADGSETVMATISIGGKLQRVAIDVDAAAPRPPTGRPGNWIEKK